MTKETIDSEGWVHTGDIGQIDTQKGILRIIDRKKNIFKLSQGEYIAPEKVENKITQSNFIAQSFVYGDSLQHFLVAVVVPDKPVLEKWVADSGI
jgi:long-chain acyl-CoA synthetase